ncbi:uncharacterized protein K02A2.6-like [Heteronotia binoei]|uniref:uncharacterized protein K02A2.6-like n=1 Tax=Heteronotia binoei TaxID=13085 RepID=UPI00292FDC34|nr:uncharacterized protein K02A2.6-like [Heteronotia binoei]
MPELDKEQPCPANKGCVLWGSRVVVPPPLRKQVLEDLHETHPGIVRMKALARSYVWWPGMDEEIEGWVRRCQPCQESRPDPPSAPVHRWESNRRPWSRLHLDFAGPYQGQIFFILVDAYTKWLEVIPVASTSTAAAVRALRRVLCTHGIPDTLVTDNGTAFTSREFREFTERSAFLFHNRITPNPITGSSPAELLMGRKLTTRLDRLHPDRAPEVRGSPEVREAVRGFFPGDPVYAKNFASGPEWVAGRVLRVTGSRSYEVTTEGGQVLRRHIDQLRRERGNGANFGAPPQQQHQRRRRGTGTTATRRRNTSADQRHQPRCRRSCCPPPQHQRCRRRRSYRLPLPPQQHKRRPRRRSCRPPPQQHQRRQFTDR